MGKLPGECSSISYDLEYGSANIELQKNAFDFCESKECARVLVVDDLLATGGTLNGACQLINDMPNAKVTHAFVVIQLGFLDGAKKMPEAIKLTSLINYE